MQKPKIVKNYLLILFSGILLIILGIILSIGTGTDMGVSQNPVIAFVVQTSGWLVLVLTVIIAPVMEEFAFRFWGVGKKWHSLVSLVLISLCLYFYFDWYWCLIFGVSIYVIYVVSKRKDLLQKYLLVAITSLAFGILHKGNVEPSVFLRYLPIYVGIGCVLCYITLRFRFVFSILLHALWNGTLLLLGGFFFFSGANTETVLFENESYRAQLTQVSALTKVTEVVKDDSIFYSRNTLTDIAVKLYEISDFVAIEAYPMSYKFYQFEAVSQSAERINKQELFNDFVQKAQLRIDTGVTQKTVYFIAIDTSFALVKNSSDEMLTTMGLLTFTISELTGCIVKPDPKHDTGATMLIDVQVLIKNKRNFKKLMLELKRNYGIYISHEKKHDIMMLKVLEGMSSSMNN